MSETPPVDNVAILPLLPPSMDAVQAAAFQYLEEVDGMFRFQTRLEADRGDSGEMFSYSIPINRRLME